MGVLEARKDAETVGYPVVGETEKDASNVIDYNIHEEITKDTSSVINANNDTTTGMANVIPGVNAPKLIANTSIIGDLGGGGVLATRSFVYVPIKYFTTGQVEQLTSGIEVTNEGGAGFTVENGTVVCGKSGIYLAHFEVTRVFGSSAFYKIVKVRKNGNNMITSTTAYNGSESLDMTVSLTNGDVFTFSCESNTTSQANLDGSMSILFTKQ